MPPSLRARVTKEIAYRYCGHALHFPLTHSLFSSAGIDSGTNQLLVLLAREVRDRRIDQVVDIGCGAGVLGVALAKRYGARLKAIDRDAMAVAWSSAVTRKNGVECEPIHAITADGVEATDYSLVVSNLPAKAGEPVLNGMIGDIARLCRSRGSLAAVVVVKPLSMWLRERLRTLGAVVVAETQSANHHSVVFDATVPSVSDTIVAMPKPPTVEFPPRFVRSLGVRFVGPQADYSIDTVFNIPEFDRLSYRLALAFDLLRSLRISGNVLIRGVRQGHLAVGIAQRSTEQTSLALCDRDLLALMAATHNCEGRIQVARVLPLPTLADLPVTQSYDWLVIDEDPEPGTPWGAEILAVSEDRLAPEAKVLIVGRSTSLTRLAKQARSRLKSASERRMRGYRAELFIRKR